MYILQNDYHNVYIFCPLFPILLTPHNLPLAITNLFYLWFQVFCFFFFKDSNNKWDDTIFVFLWLILLSIMSSNSIHVVANGKISFFFMARWYSCVRVCRIFFNYSSIDGYLGCVLVLSVVSNAAINTGV